MTTEVTDIGLCEQASDCIWHGSNTELQRAFISNAVYYRLSNPSILRASRCRLELRELWALSLDDIVYIRYIDVRLISERNRHLLVNLNDDNLRISDNSEKVSISRSKIKVTIPIHRCNLNAADIESVALLPPI